MTSLALSVLAWPLLTGGVAGPGVGEAVQLVADATPTATLSFNGTDPIITGSVATLFQSSGFVGPNRSEKVNRARLTPDGVGVSSGFDAIRTRIAALRNPAPKANTIVLPAPGAAAEISVATLEPEFNPALGAIDQIVPLAAGPEPMSAPTSLAYARETTPVTAMDLVLDKNGTAVSEKDLWCLATAVYFEARGEAYRGQVAVAQVVMNRLAHRLYPKTICGVVFQNQSMRNACQFSFACDGRPETITDSKSWKQAKEIATGVVDGSLYLPEVERATHYHATYVYPDWAPKLKRVTKIGHHIFYKFKRA